MTATILDIPSEVVLDHLLPCLSISDITSLSAVNKQFHTLASDETFWRLKTLRDFTFAPTSLAPPSSNSNWWKRVYLGLRRPKTYVWGSSDHARLGGANNHPVNQGVYRTARFIDEPAELHWEDGTERGRTFTEHLKDSLAMISGQSQGQGQDQIGAASSAGGGGKSGESAVTHKERAGMVELQASGWGFAARDYDGAVWVWGQLDGSLTRFRVPSWEDKHCQCPEPTMIPLPCKAESISTGRSHMLVLDSDNLIWELRSWGKAYHHTAPALTAPSNYGTTRTPPYVVQLTTGWTYSGCLTSDGAIHIWYPFSEAYEAGLTPDEELNGPLGTREGEDNSRSLRWGKVGNDVVITLPEIPKRPSYQNVGGGGFKKEVLRFGLKDREEHEREWEEYESTRTPKRLEEDEQVVRIASGLEFLIALKKNGEVWFVKLKSDQPYEWHYLRHFSSPQITHITATFENIASYTTPKSHSYSSYSSSSSSASGIETESKVNLARLHTPLPSNLENLAPEHLPALQGKDIIQVELGDYHFAALTSNGEMFTWGQGSSGQLGRGRVRGSHEPEIVLFPGDEPEQGSQGQGQGQGQGPQGQGTGEKEEKTEVVKNGKRRKNFVFAIAAAGWHTGALVLGDPASTKTKDTSIAQTSSNDQAEQGNASADRGMGTGMPGAWTTGPGPSGITGENRRNTVRIQPMFRIGYAGRGGNLGGLPALNRGRGRGAPSNENGNGNGNAGAGGSGSNPV